MPNIHQNEDKSYPRDSKTADIMPSTNQLLTQMNSVQSAKLPNTNSGGADHNVIFEALQTITQQQVKQILAPLMDQLTSKDQVSTRLCAVNFFRNVFLV